MPTNLPEVPNLDHLKKQAKTLLSDFHGGNAAAVARIRSQGGLREGQSAKLADAQHTVAREYGFANWSELKRHVLTARIEKSDPWREAHAAFHRGDADNVARLLERYPELRAKVNEPNMGFDCPPIVAAARSGNRKMVDVMLQFGADINARSQWWAGGFGVLDDANPEIAAFLIERGARVDAHAAAHLGMVDRLKELIDLNPGLVHARGGDGQTPLHCAANVEIAEYLLGRGADIDARDVDHESTPAQYMLDSRAELARYLVQRGCKTDILMAAALGDSGLVRKHLDGDPSSIHMRVADDYFPMVGGKNGGTIYQWRLGWYVSACQVAKKFGHEDLFGFLMEHSPAEEKLLNACWLGDESLVRALIEHQPNLCASLPNPRRTYMADAARNNNTTAVRLMLMAGLPVDTFSQQHHATPLHWAVWHGNVEMTRLILHHHPPLENTDNDFQGTPMGWALHGSENGWWRAKGDYPATIQALLDAGAKPKPNSEGSTGEAKKD